MQAQKLNKRVPGIPEEEKEGEPKAEVKAEKHKKETSSFAPRRKENSSIVS